MMQNVATMGLVELHRSEAVEVNGGGEPVTAVMLGTAAAFLGAIAGGFKWGWDNLGPIFNKWF